MKRNLQFTILMLLFISFLTSSTIYAQKWTGKGDGTSWNDPGNWDSNEVPVAGAILKITKDAVITGNVPNNPAQIKILKNISVTFDLDLTIGDGVIAQHAMTIATGSTLILGSEGNNRVFNINTAANKQGLAVFGANDNVKIVITKSTTFNAVQTQFGINIANTSTECINYGTINVDSLVTTGVKVAGTFLNKGVIIAQNVGSNGIIVVDEGKFTNDTSGVIDISVNKDDGIEVVNGGYFKNLGSISSKNSPTANYGNSAVVVNARTKAATFINAAGARLTISGTSDTSRVFKVDTMGIFENYSVLNFHGPDVDSTFVVHGTFVNHKDAYLNINTGGVAVTATGDFTNTGLVTMEDPASNFITTGTTTNNGFYAYQKVGGFSTGSGTITDNGLPADAKIDAAKECTFDIAEAAYEWFVEAVSKGTAGDDGSFSFPTKSLTSDSVVMTTSLEGVNIIVVNICDDAVEAGCGTIYNPVSLGDQEVCFGGVTPALKVEEVDGYEADWYDVPSGGTVLKTAWEYTPDITEAGIYTFYVENREVATGCVSERTAIIMTIYDLPVLTIDSTQCSTDSTYSVFFQTDANFSVSSSMGTVSSNTVTGIPVGTDVIIIVTDNSSGCTYEEIITSPDCTTATKDIFRDNSLIVYPNIVKNELFNIKINTSDVKNLIYIVSATGVTIKKINIYSKKNVKIDCSEFDSGMYFVHAVIDKKPVVVKFIVIR
jgi:hypothetical protein